MAELTEAQLAYAQCIYKARKAAGLSQQQLSALCGGSPSRVTVSRIESHASACSAETFEKIVAALKLTLLVIDRQGNELIEIGPGPAKARKRRRSKGRKAS